MLIAIPKRFEDKLRFDEESKVYEGYIHALIQNTSGLITEKAEFFPEYTIHGWPHIQAVLNHADKLIPDVTMEALSARDMTLLIAAVILHDVGMFLNKAGVCKLLAGSGSFTTSNWLDEHDWKIEWNRYIENIRRYPEEKLLYHFGASHAITEPSLSKDDLSDLDVLIIGEFLRRHHHRIGHQIVCGTMPGDRDLDVMQVGADASGNSAFGEEDRKCIGILVRSHGMPVRKTWEYIEHEIGPQHREKLTYLMTVLRIADALDADKNRAPNKDLRLAGIRTPVSVKEWTWNQRITRTALDWNNTEVYKHIEAAPKSSTEFVHLEKWLKWIQEELDLSWAVLSECCDTQKYRLSIHLIKSNILKPEGQEYYGAKFLTKDARLNANPELLKLLVAPLYGNDPSYGVRELLQNAVDACRERAYLEGDNYHGEVRICLDTEAKTLTVSDNGIGMDEHVLLNYFLSAGASYRTSDKWFEQFATDREPNIVRTGRFGVGVLAAFLLGNEIRVTTRHRSDALGYRFDFGMEPKGLDINRPTEITRIGTTITVQLKEDALQKLETDYSGEKTWLNWYRFADPSVRYWVNSEEYISQRPFIPQDDRPMPYWFDLPGTDYEMVRWGYPGDGFFCNGIRIPEAFEKEYLFQGTSIFTPSVSVIDKNGLLPLDLARRNVRSWPYSAYLKEEAVKYAIAKLLTDPWDNVQEAAYHIQWGSMAFHTESMFMKGIPYICSKEGFMLFAPSLVGNSLSIPILKAIRKKDVSMEQCLYAIRKIDPNLPVLVDRKEFSGQPMQIYGHSEVSLRYHVSNKRFWVVDTAAAQMALQKLSYDGSYQKRMLTQKCAEYRRKQITAEEVPFQLEKWDTELLVVLSEAEIQFKEQPHNNTLDDLMMRYFGDDIWIPYDMEERRKKFPKAFEELKYYIDRIIADREKERGAQNA